MLNLSIISVTFNNFEDLLLTHKSIVGCGLIDEIDFFVVNGGTCEKTKNFLIENKIRNVSEPDDGISDAFNKGIAGALKDNIIFLNSGDSLLKADYIKKAVNFLDSNEQYGFTYGQIIFRDAIAGDIVIKPHGGLVGQGMPYPHQTMIYRKSVFEKVGKFKLDYRIAMDYEHVCRMQVNKIKGKYIDDVPVSILMDGSGVSVSNEIKGIKENYRALQENGLLAENKTAFYIKLTKYYGRKTLMVLGLSKLLAIFKKLKYETYQ